MLKECNDPNIHPNHQNVPHSIWTPKPDSTESITTKSSSNSAILSLRVEIKIFARVSPDSEAENKEALWYERLAAVVCTALTSGVLWGQTAQSPHAERFRWSTCGRRWRGWVDFWILWTLCMELQDMCLRRQLRFSIFQVTRNSQWGYSHTCNLFQLEGHWVHKLKREPEDGGPGRASRLVILNSAHIGGLAWVCSKAGPP